MSRLQGIALAAAAGFFVSLYLLLYELGFYGSLACTAGGACAVVQASEYSSFLGFPVPAWGVGWYAAVLGIALWALHSERSRRGTAAALLALSAGGVAFSAYLTYVELFVLGAVCDWCLVSAALVLVIAGLSAPEARRLTGGA